VVDRDEAARDKAVLGLRNTWGAEYEANINQLKSAIRSQPFAEDLLDARFPDCRAVFNDPQFSQWLLKLVKGANVHQPSNTQSLRAEALRIQSKTGTPEYTKDERMQARYRELVALFGGSP
jgi:hypothetical protein